MIITIRDLLYWVDFINSTSSDTSSKVSKQLQQKPNQLQPVESYVHGACLVLLDSLGFGSSESLDTCCKFRQEALQYLYHQMQSIAIVNIPDNDTRFTFDTKGENPMLKVDATGLEIGSFKIKRGKHLI